MPRGRVTAQSKGTKETIADTIICINCGNKKKSDFHSNKDPFKKYFKKIPYCDNCIKEIYNKYLVQYKSMNIAVYYTCRKIDIPYNHCCYNSALEKVHNPASKLRGEENIIGAYFSIMAFAESNGWGNCFDDSQGEDSVEGITSFAEITKVKKKNALEDFIQNSNKDEYETIEFDTEDLIRKWGTYDNDELSYLECEFLEWKDKLNNHMDKATEVIIKEICLQTLYIRKARENGDLVDKQLATLQNLLKTSGLSDEKSEEKIAGSILGVTIRDIEYNKPIVPKDDSLSDVDGMRDKIFSIAGALSQSMLKKNEYVKVFERVYSKYTDNTHNRKSLK